MKFSERSPFERTAIDGWIRVSMMARENACMKVSDSFRQEQEKIISELPGDIATMLRCYSSYRHGGHSVSYTAYFQVSHPEEYAGIVRHEKKHP
jgi:hypothetical protein